MYFAKKIFSFSCFSLDHLLSPLHTDTGKRFLALLVNPSIGLANIILANGKHLMLAEIISVEIEKDNYLVFTCAEDKIIRVRSRLKEVAELLPEFAFTRINRSCLVNHHYLSEINGLDILLTNGMKHQLSRLHLENFRSKVNCQPTNFSSSPSN